MICDFLIVEFKAIPSRFTIPGFEIWYNSNLDCVEIKADADQGAKIYVGEGYIDLQKGGKCLWRINQKYLISSKRIESESGNLSEGGDA